MLQSIINIDSIIEFLQDEGLSSPIKIINEDDPIKWRININDPFLEDDKLRFGIAPKIYEDEKIRIVFNGFKSAALLGDDYHGDFFKFVKLVKNFNSREESKKWFYENYLLRGNNLFKKHSNEKAKQLIKENQQNKQTLYWPNYERFEINKKSHKKYLNYLLNRKIPLERIKSIKLFIDKKNERIVFPIYENGELIFYSRRSIIPHFLPWIKAKADDVFPIWNLENIKGEEVWLFEGIFDALCVPFGVALLGTAFLESKEKILKYNFQKIIIVLDNDNVGRTNKLKIAKELKEEYNKDVYIYNYKGIKEKDFSEMIENDIDFDFKNRIIPFNFKTELLLKLGKII